jgi:hypothetical protein
MPEVTVRPPENAFVERLKSARTTSAVLKLKLITLKSGFPDALVFAFEGDDDKIVYGQWIRRIRPELQYEPFPCGGKEGVRGLKNAVTRDLSGLGTGVFFFVDRDFDDLLGFLDTTNVFMTETYSVENCLVTDEVLDGLLRDEFPCHARPELRGSITEIFKKDYDQFLVVTADLNRRIFYARRIPIEIVKRLPDSLRHFAVINIGNIGKSSTPTGEAVVLAREPTDDEAKNLNQHFSTLSPRFRFRGKFALRFLKVWLGKLADEYDAGNLGLFGTDPPKGGVRRAEFALSNFAAKSPTNRSACFRHCDRVTFCTVL